MSIVTLYKNLKVKGNFTFEITDPCVCMCVCMCVCVESPLDYKVPSTQLEIQIFWPGYFHLMTERRKIFPVLTYWSILGPSFLFASEYPLTDGEALLSYILSLFCFL